MRDGDVVVDGDWTRNRASSSISWIPLVPLDETLLVRNDGIGIFADDVATGNMDEDGVDNDGGTIICLPTALTCGNCRRLIGLLDCVVLLVGDDVTYNTGFFLCDTFCGVSAHRLGCLIN